MKQGCFTAPLLFFLLFFSYAKNAHPFMKREENKARNTFWAFSFELFVGGGILHA